MDWHRVQQVSVDGAPAMMGGQRGFKGFVKREPEYTSRSLRHSSIFTRIQDTASFLESSFRRCCQNRELHQVKGLELSHIQTILQ